MIHVCTRVYMCVLTWITKLLFLFSEFIQTNRTITDLDERKKKKKKKKKKEKKVTSRVLLRKLKINTLKIRNDFGKHQRRQ